MPRCEDNIKMDLKEMKLQGMDWIELTEDRAQWRSLVNTVIKIQVLQKA
jgi:hypothetical protein